MAWIVKVNDVELKTPMDTEEVLDLLETGQIKPDDSVRPQDSMSYISLAEFKRRYGKAHPSPGLGPVAFMEEDETKTPFQAQGPEEGGLNNLIGVAEKIEPADPLPINTAAKKPFKIHGIVSQYVEIFMEPGSVVTHEPGSLLYKDSHVKFDVQLGKDESGILGSIWQATKRSISGEKAWLSVLKTEQPARVALSPPNLGSIVPVDLKDGEIWCQKGLFFASIGFIDISFKIIKRVQVGLFAGEGFILQKLKGEGTAFFAGGGSIIERQLAQNEILDIETGALAAWTATCKYDFTLIKSIKATIFGQEGLWFTRLEGPGTAWIQTFPDFKAEQTIGEIVSRLYPKGKT